VIGAVLVVIGAVVVIGAALFIGELTERLTVDGLKLNEFLTDELTVLLTDELTKLTWLEGLDELLIDAVLLK
jgi:hypothetical protein